MHVFPHLSVCGRHFVIIKKEVQEHTDIQKGRKKTCIAQIYKKKPLYTLTMVNPKVKSQGAHTINVTIISLFVIYLCINCKL